MAEKLKLDDGKNPFSGWPMIIAWIAMLIFAGHSITHMVGAGDTWVAMACGRHFLNQGFKDVTVEPFSANSHHAGPTGEGMKKYAKELRAEAAFQRKMADKNHFNRMTPRNGQPVHRGSNFKAGVYDYWADRCEGYENWPGWMKSFSSWIHPTGWVNQNWLTHVIFYGITHELTGSVDEPNFNALVYWKFAIYLIAIVCVYYSSRITGASPLLAAAGACLALFVGRSFYDVRPAGFSNVLSAILLLTFVLTTYRNILYIWLIVPMLAFWCNVHGGYVFAFIALVPFIGTHFLLLLNKKWRTIFYLAGAAVLFLYCLMKISNTRYVPSESQAVFLSLLGLALALIIIGFVFIRFGNSFVSLSRKGLIHTIIASIAAFFAAVLFNPFHLTNFTHTLIVSVSENAKMWKQVNEWHPAFSWSNPVGTSTPFLIALVGLVGVAILWLVSYVTRAAFAKDENLTQQRVCHYSQLVRILVTIVVGWVIFLSLQLMNPDFMGFFAVSIFAILLVLSVDINRYILVLVGLFAAMIPLVVGKESGYQGTYIFAFLILPGYFTLKMFALKRKDICWLDFLTVTVVSLVAVVLMMTLSTNNPLGFKAAENASVWQRVGDFFTYKLPFKPIFEAGGNKGLADYSKVFSYILFANLAALLGWVIVMISKGKSISQQSETKVAETTKYELPKIDLALIIIMALTVYMAIGSRRFITLAGVWMAPFLALFIDQLIRIACSIYNRTRHGEFVLTAMSGRVKNAIIIIGLAITIFFGMFWGGKYKKIYLDPFDSSQRAELSTVFMRMTASNVKPFIACRFIKDNEMSGNMFNYWTEGGFIGYGQAVDPNTGMTPLKLYMDGRAQAAYEPAAYKKWMSVMSGGPHIGNARAQRRKPTKKEFEGSGKWMNDIFQKEKVWVVLMPVNQFNSEFLKALLTQKNWQMVFTNHYQRIFVDVSTEKVKRLFSGIFNGQTKFADSLSEKLTKAYILIKTPRKDVIEQGIALLKEVVIEEPGQTSIELLQMVARYQPFKDANVQMAKDIIADYQGNEYDYLTSNGYRYRAINTLVAISILKQLDPAAAKENEELFKEVQKAASVSAKDTRW